MRWNSRYSPISLIVLIHDTSAAPSLPPPEGGATGSGALACSGSYRALVSEGVEVKGKTGTGFPSTGGVAI